jgi:CRP-like cAMP-binding protein
LVNKVDIVNRNKWPKGMKEYSILEKKISKSFLVKSLLLGGFFGRESVIGTTAAEFSAIAKTDCILVIIYLIYFTIVIKFVN